MHISNVHNFWDFKMSVCYEIHDFKKRLLLAIKVLKEFFDCIIESSASAITKQSSMPFVDQIIENSRPRVCNIVLITSK